MEEKLVIFPCNGDCATGQITWLAAQELVLEEKAEWFVSYSPKSKNSDTKHPPKLIIVDGCERKCLFKVCLENGLVGKHHLILTDVGIDPMYLQDITREDIELAKDAVVAECTEVDTMRPVLFSGCCCR